MIHKLIDSAHNFVHDNWLSWCPRGNWIHKILHESHKLVSSKGLCVSYPILCIGSDHGITQTSTSTSTSTNTNEGETAGNTGNGSSFSTNTVGENGSLVINQESPEAIAALNSAVSGDETLVTEALEYASGTSAQEAALAGQVAQSPTQQVFSPILIAGVVVAVGVVLISIFGKAK